MSKSKYFEKNGLLVKVGNSKVGMDTMIFNMGPAKTCPSKRLGFCHVEHICYAAKAERLYPNVRPYRAKQMLYWRSTDIERKVWDFYKVIKGNWGTFKKVKYFRFNESGDFFNQADAQDMEILAEFLREHFNITTYGFTARKDLDLSYVSFLVKGSGFMCKNGACFVDDGGLNIPSLTKIFGMDYATCAMDCRNCDFCKTESWSEILIFPKH